MDMEFLFESPTRYLTRLLRSLVRRRIEQRRGISYLRATIYFVYYIETMGLYRPENNFDFLINDRVARKTSDVSAADWRYQKHASVKNYHNLTRVQLQLFLVWAGNPCKTLQFIPRPFLLFSFFFLLYNHLRETGTKLR